MKKPTKRVGWRITAVRTEASSPGTLAMRATLATVCRSSSATQRSASSSGVPGGSHPSFVETARPDRRRPPFPESAARETGWRRNDSAYRRPSSNRIVVSMAPEHLIGLVSDTHGQFRDEVASALSGVSLILHSGDVGGARVLRALRDIAPVRAVFGNVDDPADPQLEPRVELTVGGLTVHVSHGHELGSSHSRKDAARVSRRHPGVRPHAPRSRGAIGPPAGGESRRRGSTTLQPASECGAPVDRKRNRCG